MKRGLIIAGFAILIAGHANAAETLPSSPDNPVTFNFTGYPNPGPIQYYKGRMLVGSSYPDAKNGGFFDTVKFAIDLTDSLPPQLRKDTDLIKVIISDPPSDFRQKNDSYTNTTGVYTLGPDLFQPAPLILYRDVKWVVPVEVAYSLVASGVLARRHHTMMDLQRKMGEIGDSTKPEFQELSAQFKELAADVLKTDQAIVDRYRCKPLLAVFAAMKVWESDPTKRDAMARNLSSRKCL